MTRRTAKGQTGLYTCLLYTSDAQCSEAINKFKTETFPAIIPIPDSHGPSGVAMAAIKANVEKAIGADILFSEDK